MNFQPGDIVKVKSGGPDMTVSSTKDGDVWCTWFVVGQFGEAKSHMFKATVLLKISG